MYYRVAQYKVSHFWIIFKSYWKPLDEDRLLKPSLSIKRNTPEMLSIGVKYSMRDLVCDVIVYRFLSFAIGKKSSE